MVFSLLLGTVEPHCRYTPDVVKILHELGTEPVGNTSAEFRAFLAHRLSLVEQTVKATKVNER
jgi:tripartite-type tricarboxylate transporter receptor subunit TctC